MPASDLPTTLNCDTYTKQPPVVEGKLDDGFADIDWQAPWLSHITQLSYLSKTIERLSRSKPQRNSLDGSDDLEGLDNVKSPNGHDISASDINTPDTIAKVLKAAMAQQAEYLQQPLPHTKPAHDHKSQTLQFVSQNVLPEGEAYEHFIGTRGNIPTRDNLHDLFNGSIWLTFPKTKAMLNYYHMLEIAAQGISERRGRVRDTITVFDENGAVLVTSDASIGEALVNFDWQASLVMPRVKWDSPQQSNNHAQAAVYIFGHALLEQLVYPRKPLCAHSIVIHVAQEFFTLSLAERMRYLDDKVAEYMDTLLSNDDVKPRQLAPLPILGVPHFWAENTDTDFYEDSFVFRSGRRQKNKK
ncbi:MULTISPECIES: DUF3025 domain-containing protein [unclassified Psychrobacter]|uniref:DUF3025 domain-containing protein n=1 Tax=unclassified Psychrobacter TaxID=196806 RepID=UPI0025B29E30|nr:MULTISPECIES: DUF3025 domain-containing protein [unclassified Psychrobacter]MDN3453346.1 DUF3025 domain-containing protein [Psychrobacter sp. APC 3350]MDN3501844.1 DUF3025 domain-containing protein [Psychrobacter sp. 5A.1]